METATSTLDRARVTPRSRIIAKAVDGRSAPARKLRDVIIEIAGSMGGWDVLGAADKALVEAIGAKVVESHALSGALASGLTVNSEDSVRVSNSLARLLRQLQQRQKTLASTPTPVSPLGGYLETIEADAE